jgi:hypothetical protein
MLNNHGGSVVEGRGRLPLAQGNTLRLVRAIVTGAEHVPGASVTLGRVAELSDERELMAHKHTGKASLRFGRSPRICWPAMSSYSAA